MDFSNEAPASPNGIPCVEHWRSKLLPSAFNAPLPMIVLPMIRLGFSFSPMPHSRRRGSGPRCCIDGRHRHPQASYFLAVSSCVTALVFGGQLDVIRVVEHDQVAQPEESGNAARPLRNLLLHAAIGR